MKQISPGTRKKARNIRLLLLDVDGVLTDGAIVVDDRGVESKRFHVHDGQGITLLIRAGIQVGLITGHFSRAVNHRAKQLGIRMVYQRAQNKIEVYEKIKLRTGLKDREIAYVGDDIVDLPILRRVGLSITVKSCWKELKQLVDYVTSGEAGQGAVREIAELVLRAQGKWRSLTQKYYGH